MMTELFHGTVIEFRELGHFGFHGGTEVRAVATGLDEERVDNHGDVSASKNKACGLQGSIKRGHQNEVNLV